MAAMDFIHKQLISAASKDALSSATLGAGIGAGAGAVNSLVTGNDTLFGGATSGAMLGAAGGAGMRYAGAKYGAGLAKMAEEGKDISGFKFSAFSNAEKPLTFMSNSEADAAAMSKVHSAMAAAKPASPVSATGASSPVAGSVSSNRAAHQQGITGSSNFIQNDAGETIAKTGNNNVRFPTMQTFDTFGNAQGGNRVRVKGATYGGNPVDRGAEHKAANLANGGADIAAQRAASNANQGNQTLQDRLSVYKINQANERAAQTQQMKSAISSMPSPGTIQKPQTAGLNSNYSAPIVPSMPSPKKFNNLTASINQVNNAQASSPYTIGMPTTSSIPGLSPGSMPNFNAGKLK